MRTLMKKLGLLAVLVLLINLGVDRLGPEGAHHYANATIDTKWDYLRRVDARADFVIIGSSRVFRQVDPAVLGEALPSRRIFNFGAEGFAVPGIWALAEDLIDGYLEPGSELLLEFYYYNKPSTINMHKPASFYNYNVERTLVLISSLWEEEISLRRKINFSVRQLINLTERLLHFGAMGRLLQPPPAGDGDEAGNLAPPRNGFSPFAADPGAAPETSELIARRERWTGLPASEQRDHMRAIAAAIAAGDDPALANPAMIAYSCELHERARQHGIRLRFFMPPSQTDARAYSSYLALPAAMRLPLCRPDDYPELYEPQHYFDGGHLDSVGAERYSRILAGQLAVP